MKLRSECTVAGGVVLVFIWMPEKCLSNICQPEKQSTRIGGSGFSGATRRCSTRHSIIDIGLSNPLSPSGARGDTSSSPTLFSSTFTVISSKVARGRRRVSSQHHHQAYAFSSIWLLRMLHLLHLFFQGSVQNSELC